MENEIEEVFAWLMRDPSTGQQGIAAIIGPLFQTVTPLVTTSREIVKQSKPIAQRVADDMGAELVLVRFVKVMEGDRVTPKPKKKTNPTFPHGKVGHA